MQVIPYVAELLAKVHEQQAQAERIVGFQSLFKCVHSPMHGYSLRSKLPAASPARCTVHWVKACVDSLTGSVCRCKHNVVSFVSDQPTRHANLYALPVLLPNQAC